MVAVKPKQQQRFMHKFVSQIMMKNAFKTVAFVIAALFYISKLSLLGVGSMNHTFQQRHLLLSPHDIVPSVIFSIPGHEERYQDTLKRTENFGFRPRVLIHDRDEEDPRRGVFHSQRNAARYGLENNFTSLLILEDDVEWDYVATPADVSASIHSLSEVDPEWLVLYLGHVPLKPMTDTGIKGHLRVWHTSYSIYAHSYVLSRRGMERISSTEYPNDFFDRTLANSNNNYAVHPQLAFQLDLPTSNGGTWWYGTIAAVRNLLRYRREAMLAEWLFRPQALQSIN